MTECDARLPGRGWRSAGDVTGGARQEGGGQPRLIAWPMPQAVVATQLPELMQSVPIQSRGHACGATVEQLRHRFVQF